MSIVVDDVLDHFTNELGLPMQVVKELPESAFEDRERGYLVKVEEKIVGLSLNGQGLTEIPSFVLECQDLQELILSNNSLSSLPQEITQLQHLQELNLAHNKFETFPTEIFSIPTLRHVSFHNNVIQALPQELGKQQNFRTLSLIDNEIREIPEEVVFSGMNILWDHDRESSKWGIFLRGNPLPSHFIPIINSGRNHLQAYYSSLKLGEIKTKEVKVILLGDGGVGKTSLVRQLCETHGSDDDDVPTKGVDIYTQPLHIEQAEYTVKFWDFGGQEIMHSLHQLFLSERGIYILVMDARREDKYPYWLSLIDMYGGDSPIFLVINKLDQNRDNFLNESKLKKSYPNIQGFFRISCVTKEGIEEFIEGLKLAISNLEITQVPIPLPWNHVKVKIDKLKKDTPIIRYNRFVEICEEEKLFDYHTQQIVLDFLHDLGIIHRYKGGLIRNTQILDPLWITQAIYKIINSDLLKERNGELSLNDLRDILHPKNPDDFVYPVDNHDFILGIMEKFEFLFPLKNDRKLIPALLLRKEPELSGIEALSGSKYYFQYEDFFNESIIIRFISRVHPHIYKRLVWREGVVLKNEKFQGIAIVKADRLRKNIEISISGKDKAGFYSVISSHLTEINKNLKIVKWKEKIPCLCSKCLSPLNSQFHFLYNYLVGCKNAGHINVVCGISFESVSIDQLLNGIDRKKEMFIQAMRELVLKDQMRPAFDQLKSYLDAFNVDNAEIQRSFGLLNNRYIKNENDYQLGLIQRGGYNIERNQIIFAFLSLLNVLGS